MLRGSGKLVRFDGHASVQGFIGTDDHMFLFNNLTWTYTTKFVEGGSSPEGLVLDSFFVESSPPVVHFPEPDSTSLALFGAVVNPLSDLSREAKTTHELFLWSIREQLGSSPGKRPFH